MNWFLNLKIGTKLLCAFFLLAFITGILGVMSITKLNLLADEDSNMYEKMTVPIGDLVDIGSNYQRVRCNLEEALRGKDATFRMSKVERAKQFDEIMVKALDHYKTTCVEGNDKVLVDKLIAINNEWEPVKDQILTLAVEGNVAEAYALLDGKGHDIVVRETAAIDSLNDSQVELAKQTSTSNTSEAESAIKEMSIIVGISVLVALFLGLFISRIIKRPMKELAFAADSIAAGDLTVEIVQGSKDEVGQLSASFGRMVAGLRELIGKVSETSSSVASATSEISTSTEQMAAGAQEQTSQAAEVAGAIEEMAKTIVENSRNASSTSETAGSAKKAAEEGGRVVEETIAGMKRIAVVVKDSAARVQELGQSSQQIGEIIDVIDDIADQTNLLALNAAIEAARAGEQGRGFAVVADEVRKLAERTSTATKEITTMIKKIQADTAEAVGSMNEGTKKVDEGILLADKAGASLHDIVGISQKVTDMVYQIAAAHEQQSTASEQISKNMESISVVTGQTAGGTEQIARAAEDLNRLTEGLAQLIGKFKLSSDQETQIRRKHHAPRMKTDRSRYAVRANGNIVHHEGATNGSNGSEA